MVSSFYSRENLVNRYSAAVLFVAICFLPGCERPHSHPYQRFVLIGNTGREVPQTAGASPAYAALALATKTGRLCVTYEFKIDIDHPEWKDRDIPACRSLYEKNPD